MRTKITMLVQELTEGGVETGRSELMTEIIRCEDVAGQARFEEMAHEMRSRLERMGKQRVSR